MKKINKNRGTTLIEILFYFLMVGTLLTVAMTFTFQILDLSKQSENLHELQANIDFMSQKIISTTKSAEAIDDANSTFDSDTGKLSLNLFESAKNPTSFYISDGDVYIKEGSDTAIKINSESIICTKLRFQKISYPKAPDQVVIDATFEPRYTDISNLEQTLSFHTSVSLRK